MVGPVSPFGQMRARTRDGRVADGGWYTWAMPIYEFVCKACEAPFEELVRNGDKPRCPQCASPDVQRVFSKFAVHSSSSNLGGGGAGKSCSSCASSSCATCN
jgi:putative FmdB family regulatory protein